LRGGIEVELMETGTAAEVESDDFYGDGTNAPDYYCSSRRFARCCDVCPPLPHNATEDETRG